MTDLNLNLSEVETMESLAWYAKDEITRLNLPLTVMTTPDGVMISGEGVETFVADAKAVNAVLRHVSRQSSN